MSKDMDIQDALAALGALSHECRLGIFRLLVKAGPEGLAAGRLADALACPQSSLSFHLSHLTRAGLLVQRREGRSLIYAVSLERFLSLLRFLLEDCCEGRSEICLPLAEMARTTSDCSKTESKG